MFDPTTEQQIKQAPLFKGLVIEKLPEKFAQAHADIVSARIHLRSHHSVADKKKLQDTIFELRRIAATYEAYAALLPDSENRTSAAFVAASAHQTVSKALRSTGACSYIGIASISPDISAALLFLFADAHADAAEAAKRIKPSIDARPIEAALVFAIRNLANGRLGKIVHRADIPSIHTEVNHDLGLLALDALCTLLLRGIISLAHRLLDLKKIDTTEENYVNSAKAHFQKVLSLASETIIDAEAAGKKLISMYPGPLHLANLLLGLEENLLNSALSRISAPKGIDKSDWRKMIQRIANQRPYLWRNHRSAINENYLEEGVSSAISFPTSGGKSMLAHLKIATVLLRQKRVIFLAPTHALIRQTVRSLKQTFKDYRIFGDVDEDVPVGGKDFRKKVNVMTPERCLMMLSIDQDVYDDVGLIVFDECHSLHPGSENRCRRNLDAMLAFLHLTNKAPEADLLLLSAMMQNTEEIADWVKDLTGRNCLAFDMNWKPTRQVRGCVVYPHDEISAFSNKTAKEIKTDSVLKGTLGLFSIRRAEYTGYAPVELLEDKLLTPSKNMTAKHNTNKVSRALAAAAARAGIKTLVFLHQPNHCESCVNNFPTISGTNPISLNKKERKWRNVVEEELGGASYCYMKLNDDGVLIKDAVSHHAQLLPEERNLHESIFSRPDGIKVLFATSTLAQGVNLPSEVVIISGYRRFVQNAENKWQKLDPHELLNAAGRAGRAGINAQGVVLLVPNEVIECDINNQVSSDHLEELKDFFGQLDQCLNVDDPFEALTDSIVNSVSQTGDAAYLLCRFPLPEPNEDNDPAKVLLSKSLMAFRARTKFQVESLNNKINLALEKRVVPDLPKEDRWIKQVYNATGIPFVLLEQIVNRLDDGAFSGTAPEVVSALFDWLEEKPSIIFRILRTESLEKIFGQDYEKIEKNKKLVIQELHRLQHSLGIWMAGKPLCEIEEAFPSKNNIDQEHCKYARVFVMKLVPELAFIASLPGLLLEAKQLSSENDTPISSVLATLSRMVREGCDSPECLAVRIHLTHSASRVAARKYYNAIRKYILPGHPDESFEETLQRIRNAYGISTFKDHGD